MSSIVLFLISVLYLISPLVFSTISSELFEFPKILFIYFIASLLLPITLVSTFKSFSLFSKKKTISWVVIGAMCLFLLSQVISTSLSIDIHTSFFGYYSRFNGGLLSLLAYLLLFASVYSFIERRQIHKLLVSILTGGFIAALWAMPSRFGYDFICLISQQTLSTSCWTNDFNPLVRLFGTLGQPNWLASFLLVQIMLCLYFLLSPVALINRLGKKKSDYLTLLLFALFSIELMWTNSRSGILAYTLILPVFCLSKWILFKIEKKPITLSKNFRILLVIFVASTLYYLIPFGLSRITPPSQKTTQTEKQVAEVAESSVTPSSSIRQIVWRGAWELTKKYPLFGTGVETFAYAYPMTRPAEHNLTSEWNFIYNKAHNEFLNYLATTGFFGLLTYVGMITAFFIPAFRYLLQHKNNQNEEKTTFVLFYICSLLTIVITNFFGFSTTITNVFFYTLPAILLIKLEEEKEPYHIQKLPFYYVAFILFCFLASTSYLLNYFFADYNYARAKEQRQISEVANAYELTQKALSLRFEPVYYDQQAFLSAHLAAALKLQKQAQQAEEFTKQAQTLNETTIIGSPYNTTYLTTKAKINYLLSLTYLEDKKKSDVFFNVALDALIKAKKISPTDPKIIYTYGALIADKDIEQAKLLLKQALQLKPDYSLASDLLKQLEGK